MAETVFVIGFPGYLAKKTTNKLCREGRHVVVLVSQKHLNEASEFTSSLKGISIIEGSTNKIDFGLAAHDYLDLASKVTTILYCELPSPSGSPVSAVQAKNAAREVIELALAAKKRPNIIFLSHFDVAGNTPGVFAEQDLDLGQSFQSLSSEDRFRAERILSRFAGKVPFVVVRSGWAVGHGDGLCPIVELLLTKDDLTSMSPKIPMYYLPIIDGDSLCKLVERLAVAGTEYMGNTVHAALQNIPKLGELLDLTKKIAQETAPSEMDIAHNARKLNRKDKSIREWSAKELLKHSLSENNFSTKKTTQTLRDISFELPEFSEVYRKLVIEAVERIQKL